MCQANANSTPGSGCASAGAPGGSDILERLVSEALKKVLQHPEMLTGSVSSGSESSIPQAIVNQVVEELKPSASQVSAEVPVSELPAPRVHKAYLPPAGIPSYKPTPISELKKRHIPVPYTPSPAPRGTSKVQVKRLSTFDDNSRQKRSKPDVKDSQKAEPEYNPETEVSVKNVTYDPSSLKYSPPHNGWSGSSQPPSYIPSLIDTLPKCSDDYIPSPVNSSVVMPQYCPTEKSGSSAEPNYIPAGSENNSTEVLYMPTVKTELQSDVMDIDFSTEFDLLDEILNENSNESQKVKKLMAEEDSTVLQSVVNSDEPKLNVESGKSVTDIDVKTDLKDVSNRSEQSQKIRTKMHDRSLSEPQVSSSSSSSSSKKEDKLERSKKSKRRRHSSEKTKEEGHKKHDHKHSSSSRSEHRKSDSKSRRSDRRGRTEKKDAGDDSVSQKHRKVKEESRMKEKRAHNFETQSEKHSSSKMLVKGKSHSGTSKLKHEGKDHHHHHHYKSRHTGQYHQNSKSHNKEHKTVTLMTRKISKEPAAEDSGINAGKLFCLY
jgi:hypothetical protein